MTMFPETILWAGSGMSLMQVTKVVNPSFVQVMQATVRAHAGQHKPSKRTLAKMLRLLPPQAIRSLPTDPSLADVLSVVPPGRQWESLAKVPLPAALCELRDLIERLNDLETTCTRIQELNAQGAMDQAERLLRRMVGYPEHYWQQYKLDVGSIFVIDPMLQALAYVDRKHVGRSGDERGCIASPVLALMKDGRTPIGHWLVRLHESAGLRSLKQLSDHIDIDLDRLKDWSSGRHLLGPDKAADLLERLGRCVDANTEILRYRNARFFSFLIEFVICSTEGLCPTWIKAQMMVRDRYHELLELAIPA